ncbi:MAG: AsnC family transcriptional regulator [Roseivivax sp.]|nr:AsnC family transcriptional regulator [Roseivivax sp.]
MPETLSAIDRRLLDDFQRDLPACPRPFAWIAERLGLDEAETIARLERQQKSGRITRVGATVRPNTAGASTLAALSVPPDRIETVAARLNALVEINHSYLREHDWNLWFVVTACDTAHLDACLARIRAETGLTVLDLRLLRPFNIDLGFSLSGAGPRRLTRAKADLEALREDDRPLLHALSQGLPLVPRPFAAIAASLDRPEAEVIDRTDALIRAAIVSRFGVIVRHRAIGWKANAMVVWDVPDTAMEDAGQSLAALPGVTLCYQRRTVPGVWRHGLFSMIHARTRDEALSVLARARALPALAGVDHQTLFSTRCFRQTGAHLARVSERAA